MKKFLIVFIISIQYLMLPAQEPARVDPFTSEPSAATESAYENADDGGLSLLEEYRVSPLNINKANLTELLSIGVLSPFQAQQLILHRAKFGNLLAIQELQVIPGWNFQLIRDLLPFITIQNSESLAASILNQFARIRHRVLIRTGNTIPLNQNKTSGSSSNYYLGSAMKILLQYRIDKGRAMQAGIIGDKDAGEYFFKKNNKWGFDHYGFYFIVREVKKIKSLAIGDFEINMGQGLIHWQSLSFKKSSDISKTERPPDFIKPHTSSGEYNFHRGVATEFKIKKVSIGYFLSIRNLSASKLYDSLLGKIIVSSINTSGYHRTNSELAGKSALKQYTIGARMHFDFKNAELNFNSVSEIFSVYLLKPAEPYNLFSLQGNKWLNLSFDYKYTYENFHFFGEYAIDKYKRQALCAGALIGISSKVDLSFLFRAIDKKFQSVMAGAFTEGTFPTNEKGFFAGIAIKPNQRWKIDAYADLYHFPWLRYLSSFPLYGKDFLLQVSYQPDKKTALIARARTEMKPVNTSSNFSSDNFHNALRLQLIHSINHQFSAKARIELLKIRASEKKSENGFLFFLDFVFKPVLKRFSMNLRFEQFETDSYDSRIYAYEPDLPFSFSLPAKSGIGKLLIFNYLVKINRFMAFSSSISQTFEYRKSLINSNKAHFFAADPSIKGQLQFQF